jgi:cobalt/nickel transport system ATP-binding protein
VAEDVSFGPLNLGLDEAEVTRRVDEALAAVEISHLAERPTHQLSFGQKKRAALAGVLAMRPEVVLLDEPTAGLDPSGVQELLNALDRLRSAGTTLVLATHDMNLAYAWADEVAVLHEGRLLGRGAPEAILGDEVLLRTARLRMPGALEMARALRECSWRVRGGFRATSPACAAFSRTSEARHSSGSAEVLRWLRARGSPRCASVHSLR